MIEPMLARLVGCVVFAGLTGALLAVVSTPSDTAKRDAVAAAELQHRVQTAMVARQ
jgi:hypothetical protein